MGSSFARWRNERKIFIGCCVLHNFLLDQMVWNNVRVGRGYLIGDSSLWLDGHTVNLLLVYMRRIHMEAFLHLYIILDLICIISIVTLSCLRNYEEYTTSGHIYGVK
jgi:hypothetical protein